MYVNKMNESTFPGSPFLAKFQITARDFTKGALPLRYIFHRFCPMFFNWNKK